MVASAWGGAVLHKSAATWHRAVVNTNPALFGLAYGNGRYLTFGDKIIAIDPPPDAEPVNLDEVPVLYSSPDLINWTPGPTNMHAFYGGAYGNGRFVLVGSEGKVLWSEDAITWTQAQTPTLAELLDVIFVYGRFVAVGHPGHVLTSENGVDWIMIPCGTYEWLNSLAPTATTIIGIGSNGAILEAPIDTWFRQPYRARGQNVFQLFSPLPTVIESSADLSTWTTFQTLASPANPYTFNSQTAEQRFFRATVPTP